MAREKSYKVFVCNWQTESNEVNLAVDTIGGALSVKTIMNKKPYNIDQKRWAILKNRKKLSEETEKFSDFFIYAVRTTGIYCLPGCSSRLPKQDNVQFFDTGKEAKETGYRACKRCEPDQLRHSKIELIERACRLIDQSQSGISLKELAKAVNLSPYHFLRQFKKYIGVTPKQYSMAKRRERLQSTLKTSNSVTEAVYEAGYGSTSRAYETSANLEVTPNDYRRGASGIDIKFSFAHCCLGLIIVAETEKGICCVEIGDSKADLESQLASRFPKAKISKGTQAMKQKVNEVVRFINNPVDEFALPLDLKGTVFQMCVWNELLKLPVGSTTTYSDIAKRIKKPKAVRAVARAISSNKIAVLVPCHRIVGKNGDISGYRWGVERKRRLLKIEQIGES